MEPSKPMRELLEDEDGAPYPPHVQEVVTDLRQQVADLQRELGEAKECYRRCDVDSDAETCAKKSGLNITRCNCDCHLVYGMTARIADLEAQLAAANQLAREAVAVAREIQHQRDVAIVVAEREKNANALTERTRLENYIRLMCEWCAKGVKLIDHNYHQPLPGQAQLERCPATPLRRELEGLKNG